MVDKYVKHHMPSLSTTVVNYKTFYVITILKEPIPTAVFEGWTVRVRMEMDQINILAGSQACIVPSLS